MSNHIHVVSNEFRDKRSNPRQGVFVTVCIAFAVALHHAMWHTSEVLRKVVPCAFLVGILLAIRLLLSREGVRSFTPKGGKHGRIPISPSL